MKTSLPSLASSFQHFGASSFTGGLLKKAGIPTRSRPVSRRAACESSPPFVSLRGTKGMQTAFGRRRRRHRRFEMMMMMTQRTKVVHTTSNDVQSLGKQQPREQRSTRRADAHHRDDAGGLKKCPVPPGKRERGPFMSPLLLREKKKTNGKTIN
tara:strand:- start:225 stop:686 length:462 start_codon:yes stop_codon:yes gene_type:complete